MHSPTSDGVRTTRLRSTEVDPRDNRPDLAKIIARQTTKTGPQTSSCGARPTIARAKKSRSPAMPDLITKGPENGQLARVATVNAAHFGGKQPAA